MLGHSGAPRSGDPGIQAAVTAGCGCRGSVWIPGPALTRGPGMTRSSPLAEQDAALHLQRAWCLDDRDRDRLRLGAEILHHRVGDVFHQRLLGVGGAPFSKMDDDLGHWILSVL